MKFRKKPIVVEAEQFWPTWFPWPERVYSRNQDNGRSYFIDTLEGEMEVTAGGWIITGIKGEKYPCKPDIFEATYEKVKEESLDSRLRGNDEDE